MATVLGQRDFAEAVLTLPGDLPRQVMNEFVHGWRMQEVMAEANQQQAAAAMGAEQHYVDGLGEVKMRITPEAFHFWGHRLGYDCWKDRQFRREFHRDNPAVRVKSVPRRTMVRVDGFRK